MPNGTDGSIDVFTTCPVLGAGGRDAFLQNVIDVARWSEKYGCKGILVYSDNSLLDPWIVSHTIIQNTTDLCPLIAVQPIYKHPYAVAKLVTSIGYLYERRIYLNMVAGGFKNDLLALNDTTPHGQRYERLVEYTTIIQRLLAGGAPVSYQGQFYEVNKLRLMPSLPQELLPGIFVSGSSEEGVAAAQAIGALAVKYPKPAADYEHMLQDDALDSGIRVGIVAREDETTAWEVAHQRFPEERRGQIVRQLATKLSDSSWHKQLSQRAETTGDDDNTYWLVPFQNYKTMCPYLVGSYQRIADELTRYIQIGFKTFILDIPASEEELHHTKIVIDRASMQAAAK